MEDLKLKFPDDFIYVKMGRCWDCDDDDTRVYKPTFRGNIRVVLFVPACKNCCIKRAEKLCSESPSASLLPLAE